LFYIVFCYFYADNKAMEPQETNGIKKFRERLGIKTQARLADMLGIERTSISVWELGKSMPGSKIMQKLLKLGATVEELFGIEYNKMHNLVEVGSAPIGSVNDLREQMMIVLKRLDELEEEKKLAKAEPEPAAQAG
jgi:DNA-binding XRE family transcriptional regulator